MQSRFCYYSFFFLIIIILVIVNSCDDKSDSPIDYDYPECDMGGQYVHTLDANDNDLTIFYHDDAKHENLIESMTNESISIAKRYNFQYSITTTSRDRLVEDISHAVLSGANSYDIVNFRVRDIASVLNRGLVKNLLNVDTLRLDQPWWDQTQILDSFVSNGNFLYFIQGDFSFSRMEETHCLFYNKELMASLNLESPEDLVNKGRWTLDELQKYIKSATNINGAQDFTLDSSIPKTYGILSDINLSDAFLASSDVNTFDFALRDGQLYFALETDRFYQVADKLSSLFHSCGSIPNEDPLANQALFNTGKALFFASELRMTDSLSMTHGILPLPKYDKKQAYHTPQSADSLVIGIPASSDNFENIGIIMDAIAYQNYTNILPIYCTERIKDSEDMLRIIHDSITFDIGDAYDLYGSLKENLRDRLYTGSADVKSIIESEKPIIETLIVDNYSFIW